LPHRCANFVAVILRDSAPRKSAREGMTEMARLQFFLAGIKELCFTRHCSMPFKSAAIQS